MDSDKISLVVFDRCAFGCICMKKRCEFKIFQCKIVSNFEVSFFRFISSGNDKKNCPSKYYVQCFPNVKHSKVKIMKLKWFAFECAASMSFGFTTKYNFIETFYANDPV